MSNITWISDHGTWVGSTGPNFPEREAFYIKKAKPRGAPSPRLARITGKKWSYVYALTARQGGVCNLIGFHPTLEAAKIAAAVQP